MIETNLILIIVGVVLCLLGWALYKAGLKIAVILSGLLIGTALSIAITDLFKIAEHFYIILAICCVISCIITGVIGGVLEKVALFIAGAILGIGVVKFLTDQLTLTQISNTKWIIDTSTKMGMSEFIAGLIGAGVALIFKKWFIVILTSAIGSVFISLGISKFNWSQQIPYNAELIVVFILGILFQLKMIKVFFKKK